MSMIRPDFDRRRFSRCRVRGVEASLGSDRPAPILELAVGGMLVEVPRWMDQDEIRTVRLDVSGSEPIHLLGLVVACRHRTLPSPKGGRPEPPFLASIRFVATRDASRARLFQLLEAHPVAAGACVLERAS